MSSGRARSAWVVAALLATGDINILKGKVRAASITTENVIIVSIRVNSASDVDESDARDGNAVAWVALPGISYITDYAGRKVCKQEKKKKKKKTRLTVGPPFR